MEWGMHRMINGMSFEEWVLWDLSVNPLPADRITQAVLRGIAQNGSQNG